MNVTWCLRSIHAVYSIPNWIQSKGKRKNNEKKNPRRKVINFDALMILSSINISIEPWPNSIILKTKKKCFSHSDVATWQYWNLIVLIHSTTEIFMEIVINRNWWCCHAVMWCEFSVFFSIVALCNLFGCCVVCLLCLDYILHSKYIWNKKKKHLPWYNWSVSFVCS